jgi:hypothetical protein
MMLMVEVVLVVLEFALMILWCSGGIVNVCCGAGK